jgi:acetone carboxylase gamma subunit
LEPSRRFRGISMKYSTEMIHDLVVGTLPLDEVGRLQRDKDLNRVERVLEIEQQRVPWDDKILVLLQEYLYVVLNKSQQRVVKCRCGHEFGDYRVNWKEFALVYDRHPQDNEIFLTNKGADPEWQVLREFYCPTCAVQLDVEPVPVGYPFIFNFLPEIDEV